jgi:GNAT superfamily N-acetyltransferase
MQIRPATTNDLDAIAEIDGTIESTQYLHLEQSGEGLSKSWRLEPRALREKLVQSFPLGDEGGFMLRQIAGGADEGLALLAVHDDQPVALLVARPDHAAGTLQILDLRVDYDFRRQGLGMALLYQAINRARELELRAVAAQTPANNFPVGQLLLRCSFDLAGIDTKRLSNHDVVKESATLIWYASLD